MVPCVWRDKDYLIISLTRFLLGKSSFVLQRKWGLESSLGLEVACGAAVGDLVYTGRGDDRGREEGQRKREKRVGKEDEHAGEEQQAKRKVTAAE